jgi:hypothetical protein
MHPNALRPAIAASIAAAAMFAAAAQAQPAPGQPLGQAMVGAWAVGGVDKCATAPYRVTLDGGTIVFRDRAGKVTRERIEAASPTAMVTRVEEGQQGKPVAVWNYERRSADTIAVTNTTTRRAFTIFRCEEAPSEATDLEGQAALAFLARFAKAPCGVSLDKPCRAPMPALILRLAAADAHGWFEARQGTPAGYRSIAVVCSDRFFAAPFAKGTQVTMRLVDYEAMFDIESAESGEKERFILGAEACAVVLPR